MVPIEASAECNKEYADANPGWCAFTYYSSTSEDNCKAEVKDTTLTSVASFCEPYVLTTNPKNYKSKRYKKAKGDHSGKTVGVLQQFFYTSDDCTIPAGNVEEGGENRKGSCVYFKPGPQR